MFLLRRWFLVNAILALIAGAQGQRAPGALAKPDFTGRWRMVKELSDFHGFQMPNIVVRVVEYHDPALNVHTIQTTGEKTAVSDVTYYTDGSVTNNAINGREAESKSYWDGDALVIRTSMKNAKGAEEQISDRWELSADKQQLIINSHVDTEKGGADLKLVSTRENVKQ